MSLEDVNKAMQAQAKRKAATEAAAREREQAEGEKQERLERLYASLSNRKFHAAYDGATLILQSEGRKYRITEVED